MEIIAVESQAYQELIDRLNRIEQYVERTSHLIQDGDVRYFFKSIVIATKCNRLRVSGMRNDEVLGRLNRFKDNLIISSCLNPKNRQL